MKQTIEQLLQQGIAAHKEGRLNHAEHFYRTILKTNPTHPHANHNLGVIAISVNKAAAALPLLKSALEFNPSIDQFWLTYIDALIKERQFDIAQQTVKLAKKQGVAKGPLNILEARLAPLTTINSAELGQSQRIERNSDDRKRKLVRRMKNNTKNKKSRTNNPSQQQLRRLIGFYRTGRLTETELLAVEITKECPEHQFAWKVLGAVLAATGRKSDAEVASRKAISLSPGDAEAHSNLGVLLNELGRLEEAEYCHTRATVLNPNLPESYFNLAITLQNLGRLEDARASYAQAIVLQPSHAEAHNNIGVVLKELGRLEEAESSYNQAIALKPSYAEAHSNLGITLKDKGRLDDAEASYNRALALKPEYADAHCNLGITLQAHGKLDEAVDSYNRAIELKSNFAEAYCNLGNTLKELGRLDEAVANYNSAIALKPDFAGAHSNLGVTLTELGMLQQAEENCKKAILLKSDYAEAHYNLGNTLKEMGRLDEAEAKYNQAIVLKHNYPEAHYNLGNVLKESRRLGEANSCYTQAIALKPDYAEAYNNRGALLQELGRLEEAKACYERAIDLKHKYAEALRNLTTIKKFDSQDDHYLRMRELYFDTTISEEQRCSINFGLAKACEDLEYFEQAFKHYCEGNALRKNFINYDINQDKTLFGSIRTNYPQILENALATDDTSNRLIPVFIVGMPRSGTTLVEQIISSHSQVTGAGELDYIHQLGASIATGITEVNNQSLSNFRGKYLTQLKTICGGNQIVTDKMPQNFRYIGLLAAAFPEAKIVHVKRNPVAVCWANYKQYFVSKSIGYCYSIDDVIKYHELYKSIMDFWKKSLSNRVFELDYELLTVNQESETRRLIEHLDLGWEEKCLSPEENQRNVSTASNIQVRKKVYKGSSEQWRKYKPYLNGALDVLVVP